MSPETIRFWADIAAIFLAINFLILTIAVGAGLGAGWWYLRKGRRALAMPFLYAQVYTLRVQNVTMKMSDVIANVPIAIDSTLVGVKATARRLRRG